MILRQKFFRGQKVRVAKDLGPSMSHFPKNCDAIIMGSYTDLCNGWNPDTFSMLLLTKNGKPFTTIAWYYDHQLTLLSDDRRRGERMIQEYNQNLYSEEY